MEQVLLPKASRLRNPPTERYHVPFSYYNHHNTPCFKMGSRWGSQAAERRQLIVSKTSIFWLDASSFIYPTRSCLDFQRCWHPLILFKSLFAIDPGQFCIPKGLVSSCKYCSVVLEKLTKLFNFFLILLCLTLIMKKAGTLNISRSYLNLFFEHVNKTAVKNNKLT